MCSVCVRKCEFHFDFGVAARRAKVKVEIEAKKPMLLRVNPMCGALSNLQAHDLEKKRTCEAC